MKHLECIFYAFFFFDFFYFLLLYLPYRYFSCIYIKFRFQFVNFWIKIINKYLIFIGRLRHGSVRHRFRDFLRHFVSIFCAANYARERSHRGGKERAKTAGNGWRADCLLCSHWHCVYRFFLILWVLTLGDLVSDEIISSVKFCKN